MILSLNQTLKLHYRNLEKSKFNTINERNLKAKPTYENRAGEKEGDRGNLE